MTPDEFYRRYPSFTPFVGSTFTPSPAHTRPRILLIGESHYLPEAATLHHRAGDTAPSTSIPSLSVSSARG